MPAPPLQCEDPFALDAINLKRALVRLEPKIQTDPLGRLRHSSIERAKTAAVGAVGRAKTNHKANRSQRTWNMPVPCCCGANMPRHSSKHRPDADSSKQCWLSSALLLRN